MKINCNVQKITNEFYAQNIKPFPIFDNEDGTGDFTFPEGTDMKLVQQIIDAHDPTPLPPQPTKEELMEQRIFELEQENLMNMMVLVELHMMIISQGGGN